DRSPFLLRPLAKFRPAADNCPTNRTPHHHPVRTHTGREGPVPAPTDNPEPTQDAAAEPRPVPPGTDQHPDTPKSNPPTLPAEPDDLLADLAAAFGDRYQIGEKLGEGGFGSVFRGFDRRLNRPVAVKAARTDADRLTQEARQLAQLRHPGIVTVHDVGIGGRRCFIVSELLS